MDYMIHYDHFEKYNPFLVMSTMISLQRIMLESCYLFTVCIQFSLVQSLSRVQLFVTPWTAACQASLSTNSWSLPKLMSIESVMPSSHLILCRPFLLLPSIFPSIRVFSSESALHMRWPKYWSFSFSIHPSNENTRLISFRMHWLDLLAVQKSSPTPQFRSINSSALSFLHSPTLTHDHWKSHSFDQIDLCWQSNVSAFYYAT